MDGYVYQEGKKIYDGTGKEFLLKGVGLGNWLLPEGYMWKFFDECDRPRRIEKLISDLCGDTYGEFFWNKYRENYISKKDIEYIKSRGLNSVRLPLNARYLFERNGTERRLLSDGIKYVDWLLDWCEELGVYVILDMHGAPGGQTGTNIDDSEDNKPLLFSDKEYRIDLIWLWKKLASRYKERKIIAGYDLLNEPLPEWFSMYNHEVMLLYYELEKAIRKVDTNHMLILEGVHWATDWSVFEELKDNPLRNCMLEFHKYWDNPDAESLDKYLNMQNKLNYPIFMGEGGENNLEWYAGVFHLLEQYGISWNFWTYKKLDTHNSPICIKKPNKWDEIIRYIKNGEAPVNAKGIFNEYLNNIEFDNCSINEDVLNHVLRIGPLSIRAIFYDSINMELYHESYIDFRSNDGSDIRFLVDKGELSFKHYGGEKIREDQRLILAIHKGESFKYTFVAHGEEIYLKVHGEKGARVKIENTGEYVGTFQIHEADNYFIGVTRNGRNDLTIYCEDGICMLECVNIMNIL